MLFYQNRKSLWKSLVSESLVCLLVLNLFISPVFGGPQAIFSMGNLPSPGTMLFMSSKISPVLAKGITVYPKNPLQFDFILDPGDVDLGGGAFEAESMKLIKYFLASLAIPEEDLWVNLSPYESNRVIPDVFGKTEMGRDLLSQDYLLKQLTASLSYPENELGSEFWNKVYERAYDLYQTTDIPMNTFNKVWIVPEKALIYEHTKGAYIVKSRLKVLLEEDYLALENNMGNEKKYLHLVKEKDVGIVSGVSSEVVKEVLIPAIEREVNEGETFANLRQIYYSFILATWYKKKLKKSLLGQVYADKKQIKGIQSKDQDAIQDIYQQYIQAYQKGAYDYIKEDYDPDVEALVPRKYFSGGVVLTGDHQKINHLVKQDVSRIEHKNLTFKIRGADSLSDHFMANHRWDQKVFEFHKGANIAVLGATGFVGRNYMSGLLDHVGGDVGKVDVLTRNPDGIGANELMGGIGDSLGVKNVSLIKGDHLDKLAVDQIIRNKKAVISTSAIAFQHTLEDGLDVSLLDSEAINYEISEAVLELIGAPVDLEKIVSATKDIKEFDEQAVQEVVKNLSGQGVVDQDRVEEAISTVIKTLKDAQLLRKEIIHNGMAPAGLGLMIKSDQPYVWTSTNNFENILGRLTDSDRARLMREVDIKAQKYLAMLRERGLKEGIDGFEEQYKKFINDDLKEHRPSKFPFVKGSVRQVNYAKVFSYAYSKHLGQRMLELIAQEDKKDIRVLMISDVYGPGQPINAEILTQKGNLRRPQVFTAAHRDIAINGGDWIPLASEGSMAHGFQKGLDGKITQNVWDDDVSKTFVEDVVQMMLRVAALERTDFPEGKVVFKVSAPPMSNEDFAREISNFFGSEVAIKTGGPRLFEKPKGQDEDLSLLGMKKLTPFNEGLSKWVASEVSDDFMSEEPVGGIALDANVLDLEVHGGGFDVNISMLRGRAQHVDIDIAAEIVCITSNIDVLPLLGLSKKD